MARVVAIAGLALAGVGAALAAPINNSWARDYNVALPVVKVAAGEAEVRTPMPNIQFTDGSGVPVHLIGFQGQVVVINFWATWCAPCVAEMSALDRLQGDMKGRPLQVVAISEDRGGIQVAKNFFTNQKLTFIRPFADPNGQTAAMLHVQGLPSSFVVDKHGRIASAISGPAVWDQGQILAKFYELTAEK